jgi:hypothetical protein
MPRRSTSSPRQPSYSSPMQPDHDILSINSALTGFKNFSELFLALLDISLLDYWYRVWVAQEIAYAQSAIILYGRLSVSYEAFQILWDLRLSQADFGAVNSYANSLAIQDARYAGPNVVPKPGQALHGIHVPLCQWMDWAIRKHCSDPRDLVFGYFGCYNFHQAAKLS